MTTSTAVVNFKSLVSSAIARSGDSLKTGESQNGRLSASNGSAGKASKVQSTASRAAVTPAESNGIDPDDDSISTVDRLDMFHATASLYDLCLPGTETEDIYASMTDSSTRTILLYTDVPTAIQECQKAYKRREEADSESKKENGEEDESATGACAAGMEVNNDSTDDGDDEDEEASVLADVFSDTDSDEDSDEEDDDENDDTDLDVETGQSDFLARVKHRRKLRKEGQWDSESIGVESRLAGVLTFRWIVQDDMQHPLVQISLLAVRPRFRKRGLGKHLLKQVKDHSISGSYAALISYVDSDAVGFFRSNGFLDDVMLCNKYIDAVDPWNSSTFMCCIPYQHQLGDDLEHISSAASLNFLSKMDVGMAAWKKLQISSYQQQVTMFEQMKRHILTLQASVSVQQDRIELLTGKVRSSEREKRAAVHELDMYKKMNQLQLDEKTKSNAEKDIAQLESEVMHAAAIRKPENP